MGPVPGPIPHGFLSGRILPKSLATLKGVFAFKFTLNFIFKPNKMTISFCGVAPPHDASRENGTQSYLCPNWEQFFLRQRRVGAPPHRATPTLYLNFCNTCSYTILLV